ncbi:hypothetical protein PINS_up000061 [Pythium insidiosum]|nr:hypothetical protein PINS_up000061 [Pythium insidiosum]
MRGGGLYLQAAMFQAVVGAGSPMAASIENCAAVDEGGGTFLTGTNSLIADVFIAQGVAVRGGGVSVRDPIASCELKNAVITNCTVSDVGGGVFLGGSNGCTLRRTTVNDSVAGDSGGGIAVLDSSIRHDGLTVFYNRANTTTGGGLLIKCASVPCAVIPARSLGDVTTLTSSIHSNDVPAEMYGANVMVSCSRQCDLQGLRVTDAVIYGGLGAGIYITGKGKTRLNAMSIENHSAMKGGGVFMTGGGSLEVANTAFVENAAIWSGGGLYVEGSGARQLPVTIKDSVFFRNTAPTSGGAMTLEFADLTSERLLAVENYLSMVDGLGGAFHAVEKTNGHVEDALFLQNYAERGGALCIAGDSVVTFEDSTLTNNAKEFEERWATLFLQRVGKHWSASVTDGVEARRGGLAYLVGKDTILYLTASKATYGHAEAGGAVFVDTGALLYVSASKLLYNKANEAGGSIALSDEGETYIELSTVGYSGK